MALSVCFRFMSLTVPLVSFVPLLGWMQFGYSSLHNHESFGGRIKPIFSMSEYGFKIKLVELHVYSTEGYIYKINPEWKLLSVP